jgi:hypothetical protein
MNRLLHHLRSNLVAYLALFIALGGTSYAVIRLPANSVGAAQIKNHVIQRVKFDPRYIDGSVRLWARVSAAGKVLAGGRGMTVVVSNAEPGNYFVNPSRTAQVAIPRGCEVIASVDVDHSDMPGYATAGVAVFSGVAQPWQVVVDTFNAQGQHAARPFDFAVIC